MTYREAKQIADYMLRREARMSRRGVRMDSADSRFDAGARLAYGIAKGMGIDTEGMSPKEVWAAISKEGGSKIGGFVRGSKEKSPLDNVEVEGMSKAEFKKFIGKAKKESARHYDKGKRVAQSDQNTYLWTYTSHGQDHVDQVIDKTNQAINVIEKIPSSPDMPITKVDRKLLLTAAQFHDTGMDGGDDKFTDDGTALRKAHGMNSAIHVLEHAKSIEKMGVNPSKAALIAFAHTKSASKVNDLANAADWEEACKTLEARVEKYNADHPRKKIEFKRSDVFEGGKPTRDNIAEMATATAALRLGDANREANIPLKSQSGGEYKIEKHPPRGCKSWEEEVANAEISITDKDGRHLLKADDPKMSKVAGRDYSARVVLGERNLLKIDTEKGNSIHVLKEVVTLENGNQSPYSTAVALYERLGELNTINKIPTGMTVKMTGVRSIQDLDAEALRAYQKMHSDVNRNLSGVKRISLEFEDGSKYAMDRSGCRLEQPKRKR